MNTFQLANLAPESSVDKIFEEMSSLFEKSGRLLVLLDETLEQDIFKNLKKNCKDENIIYIPLALGNKPKDTHLFFIEITNKELLMQVGKEIAQKFLLNFEIKNDKYLVHGFGTSSLENDQLNAKFKSSLVVQDINSKILFRWYDPRVLSYLDQIFTETELNSLLGLFEDWRFAHPTGYFSWEKQRNEKFISRKISKLSSEQSLALDLIEISNVVFVKAYEYEEIDKAQLAPKKILFNLYNAYEEHKIHRYSDLFSYGLYAEILGQYFLMHPLIKHTLDRYWMTAPDEYDFTEAMSLLDEDLWQPIKQDLNNLESISHG
ncbi:DUF4123 domain-containing protein [Acinetobacter indicus]|uniref:DUF4123 domain-containing protein n=1 Tax=Acinetobacter indicus TaxID=756892 RepID=UPI0020983469|nr:DUF4123 domain-containing protein [Acinetobacter indicus]MCO8109566.1 DUF4123 domain-containing protein [Acinetobacter indicus]